MANVGRGHLIMDAGYVHLRSIEINRRFLEHDFAHSSRVTWRFQNETKTGRETYIIAGSDPDATRCNFLAPAEFNRVVHATGQLLVRRPGGW